MLIIRYVERLCAFVYIFCRNFISTYNIFAVLTDKAMLSEEEKEFLRYWGENREKEKKSFRQLLIGLPLGLVFTLPILLNFMSGWYKRAAMIRNSSFNPLVLIVAVVVIGCFFAIFNKKHQWDMREQRYRELKVKEEKEQMQRSDTVPNQ